MSSLENERNKGVKMVWIKKNLDMHKNHSQKIVKKINTFFCHS